MSTVQELLRSASDLPGDSPRRDVEILLCHCLGKSRAWLYAWPEARLDADALAQFRELFRRRRAGEPVAYLTGQREFWSLPLAVAPTTLIPRPDTETLVEWALELPLPGAAAVLDLGTGTGAIALALASERPHWQVQGVDVSPEAVALARHNAQRCDLPQVQFSCSDWFAAVRGSFDLIVANPPYIAGDDPHLAEGDVRFEPRSALVADDSGLADLHAIVRAAPDFLNGAGWLLLEHGFEQADAVREALVAAGFERIATRVDLAGNPRISGGCRRAQ
ncbi:peptide chain release factor N(5)-glutamine methyltransferase [Haliea sp. E17]|uniref:peptide chain release factor N(5)-glutamine methyltransferase n=1 Tax=Haliea sp. E17 TaxID=3401576 RepID=UPI003AAF329A